jgi:hypothetical protein
MSVLNKSTFSAYDYKYLYNYFIFFLTFLLLTDIKCATPRKKAIDFTLALQSVPSTQ